MPSDHYEIRICADCLDYWANGLANIEDRVVAGYMTEADKQRIMDQAGIDDGWDVSLGAIHPNDTCDHDLGSEDCPLDEGTFSWSQCDSCHSQLGGDRYPAVVWRIESKRIYDLTSSGYIHLGPYPTVEAEE